MLPPAGRHEFPAVTPEAELRLALSEIRKGALRL